MSAPTRKADPDVRGDLFRRMEQASLDERRHRLRSTTMGERMEAAFELSELALQMREGLRPRT